MKIKKCVFLTSLITAVLLTVLAHSSYASTTPEGYTVLGKGNTCAYYIDNDADGYGVASPNGPDADDNDDTVNTPDTMLAKYDTLENFLTTAKGYNPLRIFYIAPDGNDTTGAVNDIAKPYAAFRSKVQTLLQPGDMVVFRQGTYTGQYYLDLSSFNATAENPLVVMSYPGEKAIIYGGGNSIGMLYSSHIVVDGLVLEALVPDRGYGVYAGYLTGVTFRNMEVAWYYTGMMAMQDLHDLVIENNVIRDSPDEHAIYLGAREYPNTNIIVRGNIFYRNARHGIQHNGRVTNMLIENNIIHSNTLGGISLIMGTSYSTIRNNLIFNNNKQGIIIYNYDSYYDYALPHDQVHNLFENNTIWIGKYTWQGTDTEPSTFEAVVFNNAGKPAEGITSFDFNTFRNNIFVTYRGPIFNFYQADYADTTTIENNVIYRLNGTEWTPQTGNIMQYGTMTYDLVGFNAFSSLFKNNTFAEPQFTCASIDDYATPEKFNLDLLSASPAIDFGSTTDAPLTDLRGNARTGLPDAGCYEYAAGGVPPTIVYGDVSGNGVITANDASLTAQYAVGLITLTPEQVQKADVSGNGEVSAADASLIAQKAVGLIDKFPVEK